MVSRKDDCALRRTGARYGGLRRSMSGCGVSFKSPLLGRVDLPQLMTSPGRGFMTVEFLSENLSLNK